MGIVTTIDSQQTPGLESAQMKHASFACEAPTRTKGVRLTEVERSRVLLES